MAFVKAKKGGPRAPQAPLGPFLALTNAMPPRPEWPAYDPCTHPHPLPSIFPSITHEIFVPSKVSTHFICIFGFLKLSSYRILCGTRISAMKFVLCPRISAMKFVLCPRISTTEIVLWGSPRISGLEISWT